MSFQEAMKGQMHDNSLSAAISLQAQYTVRYICKQFTSYTDDGVWHWQVGLHQRQVAFFLVKTSNEHKICLSKHRCSKVFFVQRDVLTAIIWWTKSGSFWPDYSSHRHSMFQNLVYLLHSSAKIWKDCKLGACMVPRPFQNITSGRFTSINILWSHLKKGHGTCTLVSWPRNFLGDIWNLDESYLCMYSPRPHSSKSLPSVIFIGWIPVVLTVGLVPSYRKMLFTMMVICCLK